MSTKQTTPITLNQHLTNLVFTKASKDARKVILTILRKQSLGHISGNTIDLTLADVRIYTDYTMLPPNFKRAKDELIVEGLLSKIPAFRSIYVMSDRYFGTAESKTERPTEKLTAKAGNKKEFADDF
jgi:hypothetical protein